MRHRKTWYLAAALLAVSACAESPTQPLSGDVEARMSRYAVAGQRSDTTRTTAADTTETVNSKYAVAGN